jgi:FdhD protein
MRLPARSLELTQVTEWSDGVVHSRQDSLAAEEPLEIRVNGSPLTVTMRTPGNDLELTAGFLLTEGIIDSRDHLAKIQADGADSGAKSNVVEAQLKHTRLTPGNLQRNFFAASGCGICGKASIEAIRRRGLRAPERGFRVSPKVLCRLPETLRADQAVFGRTGGLYAAALLMCRETSSHSGRTSVGTMQSTSLQDGLCSKTDCRSATSSWS